MIRNPDKNVAFDDILTLVNVVNWASVLTAFGETNLEPEEEMLVTYIDGNSNFGVIISSNDYFICDTYTDNFCPDEKAIPEAVHEVASVNSEGLVLRLRSGALYYKRDDEWVVDTEATQAGTLDGSLFRLLKNGTVLRDG